MKAPELYIIQYTNTKNDPQVIVYQTLAQAKADWEEVRADTPMWFGVYIYKLGQTAPLKKGLGLWD